MTVLYLASPSNNVNWGIRIQILRSPPEVTAASTSRTNRTTAVGWVELVVLAPQRGSTAERARGSLEGTLEEATRFEAIGELKVGGP